MNEIRLLIEQAPVSILAVTETWLTDDLRGLVNIPGYCYLNQLRPVGMREGVGLFIKEMISPLNKLILLNYSTNLMKV